MGENSYCNSKAQKYSAQKFLTNLKAQQHCEQKFTLKLEISTVMCANILTIIQKLNGNVRKNSYCNSKAQKLCVQKNSYCNSIAQQHSMQNILNEFESSATPCAKIHPET